MTNLINAIWENVEIAVKVMQVNNNRIKFFENKKDFEDNFNDNLKIVKEYMHNPEENLDRHKVAAIIIIALLKTQILECSENEEDDKRFVGNYVLATEVGLSYMREQLNEILKSKFGILIDRYFFPKSWTCDNDYFRVFYRNLYFADRRDEWGLNPLDIAERLFLLEYITLSKKNIDMTKLRD